jgi:hypothetical protein
MPTSTYLCMSRSRLGCDWETQLHARRIPCFLPCWPRSGECSDPLDLEAFRRKRCSGCAGACNVPGFPLESSTPFALITINNARRASIGRWPIAKAMSCVLSKPKSHRWTHPWETTILMLVLTSSKRCMVRLTPLRSLCCLSRIFEAAASNRKAQKPSMRSPEITTSGKQTVCVCVYQMVRTFCLYPIAIRGSADERPSGAQM